MTDVTQILNAIEQGDPSTAEQLLRLVYDELRKLASAKMAQEKDLAHWRQICPRAAGNGCTFACGGS